MTEMMRLMAYLEDLCSSGFWGTVTLKFGGGKVFHVTKEESIKPSQLPDHRRKNGIGGS
jgi:hypothetical protein